MNSFGLVSLHMRPRGFVGVIGWVNIPVTEKEMEIKGFIGIIYRLFWDYDRVYCANKTYLEPQNN